MFQKVFLNHDHEVEVEVGLGHALLQIKNMPPMDVGHTITCIKINKIYYFHMHINMG